MTLGEYAILVLPVVLGAGGTWLLVREVRYGHEFEEISRGMDEIRELQAIYHLNPREYWIRHQMYGLNLNRANAELMAKSFDDGQVQSAADDAYRHMDDLATSRLERWRTSGTRDVQQRRKRLLWAGLVLLLAGFAIPFVYETSKFLGS